MVSVRNLTTASLPLHFLPFPLNPSRQEQSKEPIVLLHVALASQLWDPVWHSSMSESKVTRGKKLIEERFAQLFQFVYLIFFLCIKGRLNHCLVCVYIRGPPLIELLNVSTKAGNHQEHVVTNCIPSYIFFPPSSDSATKALFPSVLVYVAC